MSTPVIDVRAAAKRYRRTRSGGRARLRRPSELFGLVEHWALRDVTFSVGPGEALGIVGVNGSGKSTLLRIVGGLTSPTRGTVEVRRRISGLLTLGESFQPVLTAEENALTAAVLAGLSVREARRRLPAMAAFAELEDVLDQPLRTYSDGMRLRLAFAVSVHVDPEIMLIDEILAVGDIRFRRKCLELMAELKASGVTIVVSSHELAQIEDLCDRALWLADGVVRADGPAAEVTAAYREAVQPDAAVVEHRGGSMRLGTRAVEITAVRLTAAGAEDIVVLTPGAALDVEIDFVAHEWIAEPIFVVAAHRERDAVTCFDVNTAADRQSAGTVHGAGTLRLHLDRLDLSTGRYFLDVGVYDADWNETLDYVWEAAPFDVVGETVSGLLDPPRRWELR